jgi:glucosamine--fructose-6-phosphate aminotransferase (isomerizing)
MCGIIGYLGGNTFVPFVLGGLKLLLNRGYDSVGISTIIENQIETIKYASTGTNDSLEILQNTVIEKGDIYKDISIGIGHTRWATHGAKTTNNAHPHSDNKQRISIVHNGIIENYVDLKTQLLEEGYHFLSQTDTEVIAVLIGKYLDKGLPVPEAIEQTIIRLSGTWAIVVVHKDFQNKLWMTRNGSPLLLGIEEEYMIVASEQMAFGNFIEKYIYLENNDIIEVSKVGKMIHFNKDIQRYSVQMKRNISIEDNPLPYSHWMLKEIMEQPDSVVRAMNNGGRLTIHNTIKLGGLENYDKELQKINHLILLGCGTSFHAGLWSLSIFKNLELFDTVSIYDGAEFTIKDVPLSGKTAILFLSQSGETKDLHRCIDIIKEKNILKIGVVNVVDSMIARETDCGVYLNAGREVAVASTKSFTNQCVVLTMIALWFSQTKDKDKNKEKRNHIIQDLRNLSFQIQTILQKWMSNDEWYSSLCSAWITQTSLFILGKGAHEAIAKEGALKMKEITYIHAEGYSSSALKHGPFALIDKKLPIILMDIGEEHRDKNRNAYQEIMAREADVLVITDNPISTYPQSFMIDKNSVFGGLLANVFLQLLSYQMAVKKGYNPDYPRNLAKVVTVE